jgi:hypothetical protein
VTREVVLQLTKKLKPLIANIYIYIYENLIGIRVACSFYKTIRGNFYLQCSEMFAIKKSVVNMVLHEFVFAMNIIFRS